MGIHIFKYEKKIKQNTHSLLGKAAIDIEYQNMIRYPILQKCSPFHLFWGSVSIVRFVLNVFQPNFSKRKSRCDVFYFSLQSFQASPLSARLPLSAQKTHPCHKTEIRIMQIIKKLKLTLLLLPIKGLFFLYLGFVLNDLTKARLKLRKIKAD